MDGGESAVVEAAQNACDLNRDLHVSVHTSRGYTVHVRGADSWFEASLSFENAVAVRGRIAHAESVARALATARAHGYAADF